MMMMISVRSQNPPKKRETAAPQNGKGNWENVPGKHPWDCPDRHGGLQVSTCSGYDFSSDVNTQTHTHTDVT